MSLPVTASTASQVAASDKTEITYFDPGWTKSSTVESNPTVHYDYTPEGWQALRQPDKVTAKEADPDERMTWEYFDDGRVKARRDPDEGGISYTYDLNNNLVSATDSTGKSSEDHSSIEILASVDSLDRLSVVRHREVVSGQADP